MKKFICFFFLFTLLFCFNGKAQVISAGGPHSLAICLDSTVKSWGYGGYGELGNGSLGSTSTPVKVSNLSSIVAVTAGDYHSLFLSRDGTVKACGRNVEGQLGDGTNINRSIPIKLNNLSGIIAVSAAADNSFFLRNDSTVWVCGSSSWGNLGNGSSSGYQNLPIQISSLSGIMAISAGGNHSIFLKNDGTVWVCGENQYGQLGDGTQVPKSPPIKLNSLNGIVAISAGSRHSLFLKNDGTVWACGENAYGQLGDGTDIDQKTPVKINNLSGIIAISAGSSHSMFLKSDGTVWTCGYNAYGQLGDGTQVTKSLPIKLNSLNGIVAISVGSLYSLFLKENGTLMACGYNFSGELGDGTNINKNFPVQTKKLCLMEGTKGVVGYAYIDINANCVVNISDIGLNQKTLLTNPESIVVQTNINGWWLIESLPPGTYTITVDTSDKWLPTCTTTQTFTVTNSDSLTIAPSFGFVSTEPCPSPTTSIMMPLLRPCFSNQYIYVQSCNDYNATGSLNGAYTDVVLDSLITVQSASLPYITLGNNTYRFNHDTINPGQCANFTLNTTLSCDAVLGQTLCVQANLYPADSCVFDDEPAPTPADFTPCSLPWDKSSLKVEGWCQNDSVYFTVTNHGSQDMDCYSPVRIYIDGNYISLDSVLLISGQTATFAFAGDGRTWHLEADQHPLHPGNSHPNATVELCGDANNWTPGLVNVLSLDDADPVVDIYCGVVTGSYDPNDKRGFPTGTVTQHFILPNGQINYVIRFQNTGTDTAFTVVIRDTLDTDLNIFSVQSGAASHNYNFRMYGPRILEWTFNNILLADSNTNEAASHGFISFTVDQLKNLADGTPINNTAGIYFDFNSPIITNTSKHIVHRNVQWMVGKEDDRLWSKDERLSVLPNPSNGSFKINYNSTALGDVKMEVYNILGAKVYESKANKNDISFNAAIHLQEIPKGAYTLIVSDSKGTYRTKIVVQ